MGPVWPLNKKLMVFTWLKPVHYLAEDWYFKKKNVQHIPQSVHSHNLAETLKDFPENHLKTTTETRMTARIQTQDLNTRKAQKNAIY